MGINIGGILGGIAGLLVPGAGTFLAPAIGAGLGTLAGGGSAKNAIKYALLGGGASALGLGSMIQDSAFGKAAAGKMGQLFGAQTAAKTAAPAAAQTAGILSSKSLINNPFLQAAVLGPMLTKEDQRNETTFTGFDDEEEYEVSDEQTAIYRENLYASRYDGTRFNTAAERDEYDRNMEDGVGINPTLYARGGLIEGPGTGTSDDIPAMIYQGGKPVQEAMLSNGEVVLSLKDLRNIGGGDAEMAGRVIGDAPNGTRGAAAAKLFRNMQEFKGA